MNALLTAMSRDMGIERYIGESDDLFTYRLCYSALGQWCLKTTLNSSYGMIGTTKHNQTLVINELLQVYAKLFPNNTDKFEDSNNTHSHFSVHIRKVYEETGYLLTDNNNRNRLANFGRGIQLGNKVLLIGIPNKEHNINGLGVFTSTAAFTSSTRDFLIRDNLTYEEYFEAKYDITDFYERDIATEELQYFNPLSANVPSQSWSSKMTTDCSIARKSEWGSFYRVIKESDTTLLFANETDEPQDDSLTAYDYRRLYFALKAHYNNPLKALIIKQDKEYSKLIIRGHLPNREYYYLLLLSWPLNHAFDKVNFLIRNDFIPEVTHTLNNIGIIVQGENTNA